MPGYYDQYSTNVPAGYGMPKYDDYGRQVNSATTLSDKMISDNRTRSMDRPRSGQLMPAKSTPAAPSAAPVQKRANPYGMSNPSVLTRIAQSNASLQHGYDQAGDNIRRNYALRGLSGSAQEASALQKLMLDQSRDVSGNTSHMRANEYDKAAMWDDAETGRVDSLLSHLQDFQERQRQFNDTLNFNKLSADRNYGLQRDQYDYNKQNDENNRNAQMIANLLGAGGTIGGALLAPATGGASLLPLLLKLLAGNSGSSYSGYQPSNLA